jgi:hypothetical protein
LWLIILQFFQRRSNGVPTHQLIPDPDWQKRLANSKPMDPYLVYADLAGYRQFDNGREPDYLPFIVQIKSGAKSFYKEAADVAKNKGLPNPNRALLISTAYRRGFTEGPDAKWARYVTCLVRKDFLSVFLDLDDLLRMQIGLARQGEPAILPEKEEKKIENFFLGNTIESSMHEKQEITVRAERYAKSEYQAREYQSADELNDDEAVLGVIDDGCPFAHPNLRDDANITRVARVWRQNQGKRNIPLYFGYGQILTKKEMYKPALATVQQKAKALRRRAMRFPVGAHGTAVTHLLAGRLDPIASQTQPIALATDRASKLPILAVEFGRGFLKDTAGSALCVQALDAVRYIIDRAETYRPLARDGETVTTADGELRVMRRVLINMSYGTLSGPHDGTSLLDEALNELITHRPRLQIVVAAGNSHRVPCHACCSLASDHAQTFSIFVSPQNALLTTAEIWLPDLPEGEEIAWELISPQGQSIALARWGFAQIPDQASLIYPRKPAGGRHGSMALLAIRPTLASEKASAAPAGVWRLALSRPHAAAGAASAQVNAWVERSDVADKSIRRQQAFFVGENIALGDAKRSLSSPASAAKVIAVGAQEALSAASPAADYSSRDSFRGLPTVLAAASLSRAQRGLRVPGALAQTSQRASGTSTAAPLHARTLA